MSDQTPLVPQVRDLRARIHGLLPQNMQARVLAGIALLMTVVIVFSDRKSGHEIKPVAAPPTTMAVDPNQGRIQDYRAGIEAATRQLAAEEAQLTQAKQKLGVQPTDAGAPVGAVPNPVPAYPEREGDS